MKPPESDVTQILEAITAGREGATDELFDRVYGELKRIAGRYMAAERADHTLQPTALVHEAYFRLLGGGRPAWENRAHFFGAAAEAMRRILVDHARRKVSLKRGGDQVRVELLEVASPGGDRLEDLLALDQALGRLEQVDPQMANVVKLRYFAGLSVDQTANAMGIAPRSVSRAWTGARAWLRREIDKPPAQETREED